MGSDTQTRAALEEHWRASEREDPKAAFGAPEWRTIHSAPYIAMTTTGAAYSII